ncbi:UNVERIFIED_CONTAM: LIMR family protein [Sesamum radiatum]|uniref:LIMR family protein n=1 Tax=Sesamum radiatum TaxID=300843 RepID=A0AAW2LBA3_SESRA
MSVYVVGSDEEISSAKFHINPPQPDLQETELDSNQSKARRKYALIRIVRGVLIFNPTRNGGFQFSPSDRSDNRVRAGLHIQCLPPCQLPAPDDANQAYFPKFVVVLGLSIAAISILMLPADVANRQACRHAIYNGACSLTLPMKDLWLAIYIVDAVLVFFVIPFAMFYYEGDQDKSVGKRLKSALIWVVLTAVVCALLLGILYGCFANICNSKMLMREIDFTAKHGDIACGKVDFTVRHLSSSTTNFPSSWDFSNSQQCIGNGAKQCSAYSANASSETTWTMRSTFPEYVVALATIVGSVLFTIFGGVGIACLPLGLIFSFIRRPKAVITRSQYIKEATDLAKKARELKKTADALHQEERSGNKGRKWRKNVKAVEKEVLLLEEDVKALEEMYPQGEKAEAAWAMTVLGYLAKLVLGVLGLIVSVAWIAHIVIYLLVNPPLSPFLNEVFIKLDDIWGLLGTVAFAFFCFYLLLAVIAGATMLGLKVVFITIHPMKWGATLMNSFLFNVGLILLCSISVIQFCATAFAYYAQATAAQEIFGHTLQSLRGIKYLYKSVTIDCIVLK